MTTIDHSTNGAVSAAPLVRPQPLGEVSSRGFFLFVTLVDVLNAQLFATPCDHRGVAPSDDCHGYAAVLQQFKRGAILHVKGFEFSAAVAVRDAAVCEHAVDVKADRFDRPSLGQNRLLELRVRWQLGEPVVGCSRSTRTG